MYSIDFCTFFFAFSGLPSYDPSKDFTCLDRSVTVPFSSVNDDFCDCADASDEPGLYNLESFKHCDQMSLTDLSYH